LTGWGTRIRSWFVTEVSSNISGTYLLSITFRGQTGGTSSVHTASDVSLDNLAYHRVDATLLCPGIAPMIRSID
jgi:hypothetical protein